MFAINPGAIDTAARITVKSTGPVLARMLAILRQHIEQDRAVLEDDLDEFTPEEIALYWPQAKRIAGDGMERQIGSDITDSPHYDRAARLRRAIAINSAHLLTEQQAILHLREQNYSNAEIADLWKDMATGLAAAQQLTLVRSPVRP